MKENRFQAKLIQRLKTDYPDAIVIPNDGNYIQGFPDVTIFAGEKYGMFECKKGEHEPHQPNQDYYIDKIDSMSFARFIYPENYESTLDEFARFINES